MMKKTRYSPQQRRRASGKTDYRKRLNLLKGGVVRLVIRKSSRSITCQAIAYSAEGDMVLASAHSNELIKLGWKLDKKNTMSAYLVGFLLGKKALKKGVKEAVVDLGVYESTKGARVYAAAKGAADAGLNIPLGRDIVPSEDRIRGKHIEEYAQKLKKDKALLEKLFSQYIRAGVDPAHVSAYFDEMKKKIEGA